MKRYASDLVRCLFPFLILASPCFAQAGNDICPLGYHKIGETKDHWICERYGEKLPVISPNFFVTEHERINLHHRVSALRIKRKKYEDKLVALKRWSVIMEMNAHDMTGIQRELIADSVAHTLAIIRFSANSLAANGYLSKTADLKISQTITVIKTALHSALASKATPNSEQKTDEIIKAVFELKNLIIVNEAVIPTHQLEALKSGLDTIPSMVQISERIVRGKDKVPWKFFLLNLDNALEAGGALFPPLGAMHSTANIIDGEIVLWQLRHDREAIDGAFIKLKSAQQYYKDRLRESGKLLDFYEERLQRGKIR